VRLSVIYKGGKASVFVDGAAMPLIETEAHSRILRLVKEGRLRFNGSGARLLSLKVMRP